MIITSPTGLYNPILPSRPSESGNFTFTISTQEPPRSPETFVQLPLSEELRKEPTLVYNKEQKRVFAGELIYDITISSNSKTGSGVRQFEVGRVLEFEDIENENADPYELKDLEMRQDLKAIDYEAVGLSQDEIKELYDASLKRQNEITSQIAIVSSSIKDNTNLISKNQAFINNSQKLYDNITSLFGDDHPSAVKVKNNLEDLGESKSELLLTRKSLQSELDSLRSELDKIREVVR